MDERDEVEQQSSIKKDKNNKKMSKTESRFKVKLESLKKCPQSTSSSSVIGKARAFFRSFEFKHLGGGGSSNNEPSSSHRCTTTNALPPLIIDDIQTNDLLLSSTEKNIRVIPNNQDASSYFHRKYKQILKPSLLSPKQYYNDIVNRRTQNYSVLIERHDPRSLSTALPLIPNFNYSTHIYSQSPPSNHLTINNGPLLHHPISTSLYTYRPLVCRQMKSPPLMSNLYYEQYKQPLSSSSMLTWSQSVRRLNTEYRSTINALQQAKECLEQVHSNPTDSLSKYVPFIAPDINNLSIRETKEPSLPPAKIHIEQIKTIPSVTFCKPKLVRPVELDTFIPIVNHVPELSIAEKNVKQDSIADIIKKFNNLGDTSSSILVKSPIIITDNHPTSEVSTPVLTRSCVPATYELKEIPDESPSQSSAVSESSINEEDSFEECSEEEITYTIETLYKSTNDNDLPSVVIRENTTEEKFHLLHEQQTKANSVCPHTTAIPSCLHSPIKQGTLSSNEKYYSIDSSSNDTRNFLSDYNSDKDDETLDDVLTFNSPLTSSISQCAIDSTLTSITSSVIPSNKGNVLKNNNKSISQIPKRYLKQPSKIVSSSNKFKPTIVNSTITPIRKPTGMMNSIVNKTSQQQSSSFEKKQHLGNDTNMTESQNRTVDQASSFAENRVKAMVNQINAAAAVSSSTNTKRITSSAIPRPVSIQPTTNSISKSSVTLVHRKTPVSVRENLLHWCQTQVAGYKNVSVTNLSSSWSDGLAFCALTHHFFPDAFDFNKLSSTNRKDNFELAFQIAEERAGVPRLLGVSDMLTMGSTQDYKCIFTYLNSFLSKVKDIHPI